MVMMLPPAVAPVDANAAEGGAGGAAQSGVLGAVSGFFTPIKSIFGK